MSSKLPISKYICIYFFRFSSKLAELNFLSISHICDYIEFPLNEKQKLSGVFDNVLRNGNPLSFPPRF